MDYRYEAGAFSLKNTLECGQCFRWSIQPDGSYCGIAGGHRLRLRQDGSILTFFDTTGEEFDRIWRKYFDFDTDYPGIYRSLCKDAVIRQAYEYTGEIHILRQEPWEGLCSFIISQNNNIPRITGIIDRLCCNFGEQLPGGDYAFPSAERLAVLEPDGSFSASGRISCQIYPGRGQKSCRRPDRFWADRFRRFGNSASRAAADLRRRTKGGRVRAFVWAISFGGISGWMYG